MKQLSSIHSRSRLLSKLVLCAAVCSLPVSLCAQNTLVLPNGDTLAGRLTSFTKSGEASFTPALTKTPVTLKSGMLKSVDFQTESSSIHEKSSEFISFSNGDSLACKINSINEKSVGFETWFAGDFTIPREFISHIAFNNDVPMKVEVKGFTWKAEKNSRWKTAPNSLTCKGNSSISTSPKTSGNQILQGSFAWTSHQPNFTLYFCSDSSNRLKIKESYYIQCSRNKLTLYRQTLSKPKRKLGEYRLTQNHKPKLQFNLELQIDRLNNQVAVIVGDLGKRIFDDLEINAPTGNDIIIHSTGNSSQTLTVSNFQLFKWADDLLDIDLINPDQEADADILIDQDKVPFVGSLANMVTTNGKRRLSFKVFSADQTVPIPFNRIKHLTFKEVESDTTPAKGAYVAKLTDDTELSLASLAIKGKKVHAEHPILGDLAFDISILNKLSVKQESQHE